MISLIPQELKQKMFDALIEFIGYQLLNVTNESVKTKFLSLSSKMAFQHAVNAALDRGVSRFEEEYIKQDRDLVLTLSTISDVWQNREVRETILALISRPGIIRESEHNVIRYHFESILPNYYDQDRVNKAVIWLLRYIAEEVWSIPGARELRELYSLQAQISIAKVGNEQLQLTRQHIELQKSQLQMHLQSNIINKELHQALVQLTAHLERKLLESSTVVTASSKSGPYHNLPQPLYNVFVGRQREIGLLRSYLSANENRFHVMTITGIGGAGKSALAQNIAYKYAELYSSLSLENRFDAIVWVSAKEEILTVEGKEPANLPSLQFRGLEDIYRSIALTLEREDITRALTNEQDRLVQKVLREHRTLLIIDNMECVTDKRVKVFLRNVPSPTKVLITSREWIGEAIRIELLSLTFEDADRLIVEEALVRGINLNDEERKQLTKLTQGLPLPITLSVSRLANNETFEQVTHWLNDYQHGELPEYCVKGQVKLIQEQTPHALPLLQACALFDRDAGASREALGVISDLATLDRDAGLVLLQRLSLVYYSDDDRFYLLPIVQGYIIGLLLNTETEQLLIERWLNWLVDFARKYGGDWHLPIDRIHTFSHEYPNLRLAIYWCGKNSEWNKLLELTHYTRFYPYLNGLLNELREIMELSMYAAIKLGMEEKAGEFIRQLARQARMHSQFEDALRYLDRAEAIAQQNGDEIELSKSLYIRSGIYVLQGQIEDANRTAMTVFDVGERYNDLDLLEMGANRISEIRSAQGHTIDALKWVDRAEAWASEIGSARLMAWNIYRRGRYLMQQGSMIEAEKCFLTSMDMATSWNERRLMAHNKFYIAHLNARLGKYDRSVVFARESRELYDKMGIVNERTEAEELLRQVEELDSLLMRLLDNNNRH